MRIARVLKYGGKISDNLFLRVRNSGKAWINRYEKDGKTIKLGLGPYPAVALAQARAKAYEASSLRAGGQDLKEVRRQREEQERVALNTFELLARAWVASARKDRQWSIGYAGKVIRHLEIHVVRTPTGSVPVHGRPRNLPGFQFMAARRKRLHPYIRT